MYEIRVCDGNFGVYNSDGDCLCEFHSLQIAAAFVNYIQGGCVSEHEKYLIDEDIYRFHKKRENVTKRGG